LGLKRRYHKVILRLGDEANNSRIRELLNMMAHYVFDFEANEPLSVDEEGLALPDPALDQAPAAVVDVSRSAVSEAVREQRYRGIPLDLIS